MVRKNNNDGFEFEQSPVPRSPVSEKVPKKDEEEKPQAANDDVKKQSPKKEDEQSDMHLYASFKRMLKGLPERKISDFLKKLINPTPKEPSKTISNAKLPTQGTGSGKIPEPKNPRKR